MSMPLPPARSVLSNDARAPECIVFGFPAAGGSAQHFTGWSEWLPPGVTVQPVDLPGHGTRRSEPAIGDWPRLVAAACEVVRHRATGRYALAGHSFGALLAYEVAAKLAGPGPEPAGPGPELLIVAGRNGPTAGLAHRPLHPLDDDRLIEALRRLGGTPAEVLAEPALMRLALPLLRTDLRLAETYARPPRAALPCPIIAVVGRHDRMADPLGTLAWQRETTGRFDLTLVDAGHFLLGDRQVTSAVAARLSELIESRTTSG